MTRRTDGAFPVWEILPGQLFQRGKLNDMDLDRKREGLQFFGITYAVALAPLSPDLYLNARRKGLTYLHRPIPDGLLKLDLLPVSAELAAHIRDGGTVLTMCNAGRNRSGLLSALVVRELTGLPGAAAMEVVRRHRPNAIANPHFEAFLRGLE